MWSCVFILGISAGALEGVGCETSSCENCHSILNDGCDIRSDANKVDTEGRYCPGKCFMEVIQSGAGMVPEVKKGCHPSSEGPCTENSYSIQGTTYLSACCEGAVCNHDMSSKVFECYECDGTADECPEVDFVQSDTVYCSTYCQKQIVRSPGLQPRITRRCVSSCKDDNITYYGSTMETHCCRGVACNQATGLNEGNMLYIVLALGLTGLTVLVSKLISV